MNTIRSKTHFSLYFILYFNIFLLSNQEYKELNLEIHLNSNELDAFNIIEYQDKNKCPQWVPSLTLPISFIHREINVSDFRYFGEDTIKLPFFPLTEKEYLTIQLFDYQLLEKYNAVLAKIKFESSIDKCYFGLSNGFLENNEILKDNHTNLEVLLDNKEINRTIFSFSKWAINLDEHIIKSHFYFGDIHENFNSENGIIGSCDAIKNESLWGCYFPKISFNNSLPVKLTDDKGIFYKIFFSIENHIIIIPSSFQIIFDNITNNACQENDPFLSCNFFGENNHVEIKLIDEERMNITIEIDEIYRYIFNNTNYNQTRILYQPTDYFILPLIMFKNFHVQFDAENYKISFYTTNPDILQVKEKKKNKKKKNSSNVGTIFLVIFIILLSLALIYGIFWIFKKRRNSVENNINKYNKFEDEENFQDMNEKRIF